jgi:hypothetical protein
LMTPGIIHVTNRVTPGSECNSTRGCLSQLGETAMLKNGHDLPLAIRLCRTLGAAVQVVTHSLKAAWLQPVEPIKVKQRFQS